MGFLTQRFPDRISAGAVGGPGFSTTVVATFGGAESRNSNWAASRHRYNVSQGIKDDTDARTCDAFFRKARGRAHAFRFKDWMDYRLATTDSRIVMITATTGQLCKVYGADEATYEEVRELTRIVDGTVHVYNNGVELVEGPGAGKYQIDVDTGIITYGTAPGGATRTAACEFDVPCRFDFDEKQAGLVRRYPDGTIAASWPDISIVEVKGE